MKQQMIPQNNLISNAERITASVTALFPKSLVSAVNELANDPTRKDEEKYLYFPCTQTFNARYFENLFFYPEQISFKSDSEIEGRAVYTSWESALGGREIIKQTRERKLHDSFIICSLIPQIIIDHVNREGKSRLSERFKEDYLRAIKEYFGKTIRWNPLLETI